MRGFVAAAAVAAVLVVSGCSGQDAAAGRAGDIAFAQQMIPHHEQALEMAEVALTKKTSPAIERLARDIRRAQEPEIVLMRQWLADWGAAAPDHAGEAGASAAADEHGHDMPGMATGDELMALTEASGSEFDRVWLELMVAHHAGAIEMAEQVAGSTDDLEVRALADAVVTGQAAEIARMQELLDR